MPAPTKTSRVVPVGTPSTNRRLPDGFKTTIAFSLAPAIALWEKTVMPPGIEGGEPINISTMLNNYWHTKWPRSLVDISDAQSEYAYDPDAVWATGANVLGILNVNQSITVWFPDNSAISFYGWLRSFKHKSHVEGEFPLADSIIVVSNTDSNFNEQGPVFSPAAGT